MHFRMKNGLAAMAENTYFHGRLGNEAFQFAEYFAKEAVWACADLPIS